MKRTNYRLSSHKIDLFDSKNLKPAWEFCPVCNAKSHKKRTPEIFCIAQNANKNGISRIKKLWCREMEDSLKQSKKELEE